MGLRLKGYEGWFFLLMISPLFPNKVSLILIYAFILVLVYSRIFFKPGNPLENHHKWILWLSITFFLFYVLSLLWGEDLFIGLKSVEKKLLFLVLPALFLLLGKRTNDVGNSVSIYIGFVNLALLTCLGIALYQALKYIGFQSWPFKYYNFTYWIGIHPGYLSLLVLLSLVCISFILKEKSGKGKIWWISLIFQSFML